MIRVGIAGYGLAGSVFHAPLVATTPGLELVGVVTRDPVRSDQVGVDHPDAVVVPDVDALFGLGIDLLVVASTNATHVPSPARRSQQVCCRRRQAARPHRRPRVRRWSRRPRPAGVLLSTFQNRRWDSDFRTLRTLVTAGALGDVRRLESRFERWRPALGGGWRERDDPGRPAACSSTSAATWSTRRSCCSARWCRSTPRPTGALARAADDDVFIALEHASGARSHLWASPWRRSRARASGPSARGRLHLPRRWTARRTPCGQGGRPGPGWGEVPPERWGVLGTVDEEAPVASLPGAYPTYYAEMALAVVRPPQGRPVASRPAVAAASSGAALPGDRRIVVPVDPRDSVRRPGAPRGRTALSLTHAVVPV